MQMYKNTEKFDINNFVNVYIVLLKKVHRFEENDLKQNPNKKFEIVAFFLYPYY